MTAWFLGSGRFGALCLGHLGGAVSLVVTALPTAAGRGMRERPSPVEEAALKMGLALERTGPLSENGALTARLGSEAPDALIVADFGQMIRPPFLDALCLNIHPSLLPRWRGAAPVPRALMSGDRTTGVTVFRLARGMDDGPVLGQRACPAEGETAASLYPKLARMGAELVLEGLTALQAGTARFTDQDPDLATHAPKLSREEFQASWEWPAGRIHNAARALDASGGAFVLSPHGRLKLWRTSPAGGGGGPGEVLSLDPLTVACGEGALRLEEVQAEGRRRTGGAEWARGLRLKVGERL